MGTGSKVAGIGGLPLRCGTDSLDFSAPLPPVQRSPVELDVENQ